MHIWLVLTVPPNNVEKVSGARSLGRAGKKDHEGDADGDENLGLHGCTTGNCLGGLTFA